MKFDNRMRRDFPRDPTPGGFSDDDLGLGPYSRMANATRHDHWSSIVVFMAIIFTGFLVMLGVWACVAHVWWWAIPAWIAAVINMCYWGSQ